MARAERSTGTADMLGTSGHDRYQVSPVKRTGVVLDRRANVSVREGKSKHSVLSNLDRRANV